MGGLKIRIWLEYPEGFPDRWIAAVVKRVKMQETKRGSGLAQGLALRCLVETQIEMS